MPPVSTRKKRERGQEPPAAAPVVPAANAEYNPPAALVALLAGLAVGGAGYYIAEGLGAVGAGEGRLAAQLLRVESKAQTPPAFNLQDIGGKSVSLTDFRGKVVFINFWATWCPPCIEEMPSMRRLQAKFQGDDRFVMLAISADEDWQPVREFFSKEPAPFRVALDAKGELAKRYGTEKFPETYILVDGQLVGYIIGPRDWDTWFAEAYLRALLDKGPWS